MKPVSSEGMLYKYNQYYSEVGLGKEEVNNVYLVESFVELSDTCGLHQLMGVCSVVMEMVQLLSFKFSHVIVDQWTTGGRSRTLQM